MDTQEALKSAIVKWAEKEGAKVVTTILASDKDLKMSISQAEKLATGRYQSVIRPKLATKLTLKLQKCGYLPARRRAA